MELGKINGFDNHLIDIVDFEFNSETTFWFKWSAPSELILHAIPGSEWEEVNPFTEWALHFDSDKTNLKFLFGYNFGFSGEIDIVLYANVDGVESVVYDGKLSV